SAKTAWLPAACEEMEAVAEIVRFPGRVRRVHEDAPGIVVGGRQIGAASKIRRTRPTTTDYRPERKAREFRQRKEVPPARHNSRQAKRSQESTNRPGSRARGRAPR